MFSSSLHAYFTQYLLNHVFHPQFSSPCANLWPLTRCSIKGLNLDTLAARGRFLFVDGLSRLFLGGGNRAAGPPDGRGSSHQQQQLYLDSPCLADVARVLGAAVEKLQAAGGKVVLILDQPDVLLAAASPGDGVTGTAWKYVVLGLREVSAFYPCGFPFLNWHDLAQRGEMYRRSTLNCTLNGYRALLSSSQTTTPASDSADQMRNRKSTQPSSRCRRMSHWSPRRLRRWRRSTLPSSCP